MTISGENVGPQVVLGNDVTITFNIDLRFFDATDLTFTRVAADGTETGLTLGVDYTVTGGDGGTGAFTTSGFTLATGERISIELAQPAIQTLDLPRNGALPADALEQALDKLTLAIQRSLAVAGKAVAINKVDNAVDPELPQLEANKILGVNGTATGFALFELVDLTATAVSTFGASLLSATDAAAGRDVLNAARKGHLPGVSVRANTNSTITTDDAGKLVLFDVGASSRIATLPSATIVGANYTVGVRLNTQATEGGELVTIAPVGGQTIDGFSTFVLKFAGDTVWLVSNGTNWLSYDAKLRAIERVFTTSGTFLVTPGRRDVLAELVGGGGSGGGAEGDTGNAASGGGGGGGYVRKRFDGLTLVGGVAFTIGAGGAAAAGGDNNGSSGGTSTFGSMSAGGGGPGTGGTNTATTDDPPGGAGGTAAGGDLNLPGQRGGNGRVTDGLTHSGNYGGAAGGPYGQMQTPTGFGQNPNVATGFGNGSSGVNTGFTDRASAAGSGGVLLVTER